MATGTMWICISTPANCVYHILQEVGAEKKYPTNTLLPYYRIKMLLAPASKGALRYREVAMEDYLTPTSK